MIRKIDERVICSIDEAKGYVRARRNVFADSTRVYVVRGLYINGVYFVLKEISRYGSEKETAFWIFTSQGVFVANGNLTSQELLEELEKKFSVR